MLNEKYRTNFKLPTKQTNHTNVTMFIVLFIAIIAQFSEAIPPNVIFILADDLGYDDISWNNPDIISPNLEGLANDGIILEGHYVLPVCSPSRSALMSGFYPIHIGRQDGVIDPLEPKGLFTNFTIMPKYFKEVGYRTHALGKWHLGFCNEDYLPTRRGFDTFYGFYLGEEDHFSHTRRPKIGKKTPGYDFRDQEKVDFTAKGTYSSILLAKRAVRVIKDHAQNHSNKPLFMYLPFQNVHGPLQAPIEFEKLYPNIKNKRRKTLSGMVSAMDDAVGKIVNALKEEELIENTIIVFSSDNGAPSHRYGSNYPLRGTKGSLWEGGTRSAAFIYSSMLKGKGSKNNEMIHIVDWIPTLLSAVKDKLSNDYQSKVEEFLSENRDGINLWPMLMGNDGNVRREFLYNIDPTFSDDGFEGHGAIRVGDLKLAVGKPGDHDGRYPPGNFTETILREVSPYLMDGRKYYLFNIREDPYECKNIAEDNLDIVEDMRARYEEYEASMIPPDNADQTGQGNPSHFGGVWSTGWCDSEPAALVEETLP